MIDPQYTFARAQDDVVLRMGRRNDNYFLNRAADWLDSAQYRIAASFVEIPDLEDQLSLPMTEAVAEYDLRTTSPPLTDIIGIKWVKNESTGYNMRRFSYQEYQELVNQPSGDPIRWARNGWRFAVDPMPLTSGYDVTVRFRRNPQHGVLELPNQWQDACIKLAVSLGWSALMEHERAKAVLAELPPILQMAIAQQLDQYQWESAFDPDLGIRPTSWGY